MAAVIELVPALASAIEDRRKKLEMSIQDLVDTSGVTRQGLAPLLRGEHRAYQDRLKLPVCRALGWSPDSIDRLLDGKDPLINDRAITAIEDRALAAAQWDEEMLRIRGEFRETLLADTDELPADSPAMQARLAVLRDFDERLRKLEGWAVMQMTLKELRDVVGRIAANPEQFAVTAEGADGSPTAVDEQVVRPQPDVEED